MATIRRQVKNVAYNFSDAQVKVREATSNDPWGPSSSLMSEIADLTHNSMSFTEIMSLLWKRLNDHGKNWRHVYKSLVLLDYLIKCGSEKVAQQCRENIYSIETLKDFQHIEDNKDQGLNVREKAKQMVALLYDEERLKNERTRAQMARKRFAQNNMAISSDGSTHRMPKMETSGIDPDLEDVRPASAGEEELQLQIALALSREENHREEELRKGDDIRLQMALNESRKEGGGPRTISVDSSSESNLAIGGPPPTHHSTSAIDDLLSIGLGTPAAPTPAWGGSVADPWRPAPAAVDPWAPVAPSTTTIGAAAAVDPWATRVLPATTPAASVIKPTNDPWAPLSNGSSSPLSAASNTNGSNGRILSNDDSMMMFGGGYETNTTAAASQRNRDVKTPENFLGENSSLVNLDNLMGPSKSQNIVAPPKVNNPFLSSSQPTNPFAAQQRPSPTLNEMLAQNSVRPATAAGGSGIYWGGIGGGLPAPIQPTQTTGGGRDNATNPFL